MRTDPDFKRAMSTHALGVAEVRAKLEQCLTYVPIRPRQGLPPMSFSSSPIRRISSGQMPRDFVLRTLGNEVCVKVLHVPGTASSSLYRSVAYMLMADNDYLQVVSGKSAAEVHKQLWWLDEHQSQLQVTAPTGVRALDDVLGVIADIKGWQGICDES